MSKGQQTFRKRQRERNLREKAELKRQRREQRRLEKKESPADLSPADPVPDHLAEGSPAPEESRD